MTHSTVTEIPVVFDCQGESLVGVIHRPEKVSGHGVLTVVAGGPQYRAGVGRGLVGMARDLSAKGIPVMRFDHRGLGDGSGIFRGFEYLEEDLKSAVAAFRSQVPQLEKVVLWGGCDAASAIMIHAHRIPEVSSIMVGNPWVSTSSTQAAVERRHYMKRLGEWSFWKKLLRFEYNVFDYGKAIISKIGARLSSSRSGTKDGDSSAGKNSETFVDRMLAGLTLFEGPVLFVMSGQSLLSKEFDELTQRSKAWEEVYSRPSNGRIDLPDADQAFSSQEAKESVNEAVYGWLQQLD